jgi:hypothetical protein
MARMKGQAYVLPETLIDILQLLTFVALFVGTFLIFTNYNVTIKSSLEDREAFDFINVISGDKCLLFEKDGNFFRGIFEVEKLKNGRLCVRQNKFSIKIEDLNGDAFSFGDCKNEKYSIPVVVKDGENYILGKMVVCY